MKEELLYRLNMACLLAGTGETPKRRRGACTRKPPGEGGSSISKKGGDKRI